MEKDFDEMNEQQSVQNNESEGTTYGYGSQYNPGYEQDQSREGQQGQPAEENPTYYNGFHNYNGFEANPGGAYGMPDGNGGKKKHSNKALKICAIVGLGLVVGVGSFGMLKGIDSLNGQNNTVVENGTNGDSAGDSNEGGSTNNIPIGSTETVNNGNDKSGVSSVVESALPSIVMINCNVATTQYGQSAQGVASGSGIIIKEDSKCLYIVTNYHVVSDAKTISVVFNDSKSVEATLKAYDSTNDLAVIKVDLSKIKDSTKKAIKIATLGSSDDLKVGAMAIAIGNALGYGQSVTVGYVSAKDRAVTMDNSTRVLLQTDAAINPGNSGGALLDVNGKVIGINSAKYTSTDVEGVCYAIPISKAIPIINDLMTKNTLSDEEKGYLGITGADVDETIHAYYNVPLGVRVTGVTNKGASDQAGIKENDIITKVNGIEVTSISALKERVNSYKVGTEVTITLQRQTNGAYKEMNVKVKLEKGATTSSNQKAPSTNNGSNDGGNYYFFGNGDGSNGSDGSQFPFNLH